MVVKRSGLRRVLVGLLLPLPLGLFAAPLVQITYLNYEDFVWEGRRIRQEGSYER